MNDFIKNPQTRNARAFLPLNISVVGSVKEEVEVSRLVTIQRTTCKLLIDLDDIYTSRIHLVNDFGAPVRAINHNADQSVPCTANSNF